MSTTVPTETVTALGMFDGVHRGHQRILSHALEIAEHDHAVPAVFTFLEHPVKVLAPERAPVLLTNAVRRAELFRELGVKRIEMVPFDESLSRMDPETFVQRLVVEHMRARAVVVGFNYHFGYQRAGTPEVLRRLGDNFGFSVHVVDPVDVDGESISSSRIRRAIEQGDIAAAERMLGRSVRTEGLVMPGAGLAKQIGYPTANLCIDPDLVLPADGIYAVSLPPGTLEERRLDGIAYRGKRPTRHEGAHPLPAHALERLLEIHIFDWEGQLSGRRMQVELVCYLRGDRQFDSPKQLVEQIHRDVEQARVVLSQHAGKAHA